ESHYGKLARQAIPAPPSATEPAQSEERRASWPKPVAADKLHIGYKSPSQRDGEYVALEVMSEILFGGNSSRLQKKLVADTEIVATVHAYPAPFRDPALYEISCSMQRGHSAHEAERLIYDELDRLKREGLQPGELDTAKTRLATRFWQGLRPNDGK